MKDETVINLPGIVSPFQLYCGLRIGQRKVTDWIVHEVSMGYITFLYGMKYNADKCNALLLESCS